MARLESFPAQIETVNYVVGLVEVFRAFDSDNDGFITAAELGGIMASLGYNASEQDVMAMMQQGDTNKDGLLSTEEFLEMNTKNMQLGGLADTFRAAIEALMNVGGGGGGDKVLTAVELCEVIRNLGLEIPLQTCQDIISSLDGDGDGAVSFEDFKLIVGSLL